PCFLREEGSEILQLLVEHLARHARSVQVRNPSKSPNTTCSSGVDRRVTPSHERPMHNRCIVMTTTERLRMNVRRAGSIALALVAVAAASACGSSGGTKTVTKSQASGGGDSKVLVGAGSTFVAPLVQQWEADYV